MEVKIMKTKRTKKLLAFLITSVMAVMLLGSVVNAAENYTPVAGTSVTFTKYLVVPNDTNIPAFTFQYQIASGTAVNGSATSMPIYAGGDTTRVTGTPTVGTAVFTAGQDTTPGTATDGIANSVDHRYASQTVSVSFSTVSFKEPGTYRYIITENTTTPTNVTFDTAPERTLDVNVVDEDGSLIIESYVMYYGTVTGPQSKTDVKTAYKKAKETGIATGDKCDNYINRFPSQSLYVGKKIDGNQASKDKYFKFTVSLSGVGAGTIIHVIGDFTTTAIAQNVNGATTDIPAGGHTNKGVITAADDGTISETYYLQGGQYIQLQGVPTGATYTVSEADYTTDGYVSAGTSATNSFTIDGLTGITFDDPLTSTVAEGTNYATGYINTKQGAIPTGVLLSVGGILGVGVIVAAGFVFFGIRSKRRYEED